MSSRKQPKPKYLSDPKVIAVRSALQDRDPFCSGICEIPDYQRHLHYTHGNDNHRIDFPNPRSDDLDVLYRACKPAEFGRGGENVFDESYRKAGKMDLTSFSTLFDPWSVGIHEQVSKALLTQSHASMVMELYKLNVYGEGDFFKVHKDTPRSQSMFGSLVVVLPTAYEGGQFVLRQDKKEWTLDFAGNFATATEPSVCFIAFYGDLEHEVLPVTSGYRVTLTYNLYRTPIHPDAASIPTPTHLKLEQALVDLVNDTSKLPNGGYLGFGLVHEYVHTKQNLLEPIQDQLKGSDRMLANVCDALGLHYSIRLFYRDILGISLLTTEALDVDDTLYMEAKTEDYLREALSGLTTNQVEGVVIRGKPSFQREFLQQFYKDPATQVMEITRMKSSVDIRAPIMTYGNEMELEFFYGTACMVITVEPAVSRRVLAM